MNEAVWSLGSGVIFAIGLAISGMTLPSKVSGFLDFFGRWDPSLAFVMGGAVAVYVLAHRVERSRAKPFFADRFPERSRNVVDRRLLGGAAIFGIGWGLSGFCPGPALVSVGAGAHAALWFVPAMVAGMFASRWLDRRESARAAECGV
jgi:uncharacterized protein